MPKTSTKSRAEFQITGVTTTDQVPKWSRRETKYDPITEAVKGLGIGKTLTIEFPDRKTAQKAVNNVRDALNDAAATARHLHQTPEIAGLVTTRVVGDEDGATAYVSMVDYDKNIRKPRTAVRRK